MHHYNEKWILLFYAIPDRFNSSNEGGIGNRLRYGKFLYMINELQREWLMEKYHQLQISTLRRIQKKSCPFMAFMTRDSFNVQKQ